MYIVIWKRNNVTQNMRYSDIRCIVNALKIVPEYEHEQVRVHIHSPRLQNSVLRFF